MSTDPTRPLGAARWTPAEYRQRPREYDFDLADQILMRVENGEFLPDICDSRDMPMPATFLRWCRSDPALDERYEAAQRLRAELAFDGSVCETYRDEDPRLLKIRSEALFRHAERTLPERYGPRAVTRAAPPEEGVGGGVDYQALVRRRLDDMRQRHQERLRAQEQDAADAASRSTGAS